MDGYSATDKPFPRGELCYQTPYQVKGYYKDPEGTAGLLTDDGFIITGDIVELIAEHTIKIIDRRKDVIKLSQAEYVAVGPLGATFEGYYSTACNGHGSAQAPYAGTTIADLIAGDVEYVHL